MVDLAYAGKILAHVSTRAVVMEDSYASTIFTVTSIDTPQN